MKKRTKIALGVMMTVVCLLFGGYFYLSSMDVPQCINVLSGNESVISYSLPLSVYLETSNNDNISINGEIKDSYTIRLSDAVHIYAQTPGTVEFHAKILGLVPVKSISVNVYPDTKLYPSGELVGLNMNSKGVIVVGFDDIEANGKVYSPGEDAGLEKGDVILKANGKDIESIDTFKEVLALHAAKEIELEVDRQKEIITLKIKPVVDLASGEVMIGTWVRDNVSGIGTLTAYTVDMKQFCALGHAITDSNTDTIMPVKQGSVCYATLVSVVKGKVNNPGEIRGMFFENSLNVGSIDKNNEFGIFGTLTASLDESEYEAMDVAFQSEIEEGKAQILTTVDEDGPQLYDIQIEKVQKQSEKSTKSMQIRVTDKELLEKTGGIVQGMSGSPIIQNGKIVGAVTHVFVNDPTRGYGIFIEWMLEEMQMNAAQN